MPGFNPGVCLRRSSMFPLKPQLRAPGQPAGERHRVYRRSPELTATAEASPRSRRAARPSARRRTRRCSPEAPGRPGRQVRLSAVVVRERVEDPELRRAEADREPSHRLLLLADEREPLVEEPLHRPPGPPWRVSAPIAPSSPLWSPYDLSLPSLALSNRRVASRGSPDGLRRPSDGLRPRLAR